MSETAPLTVLLVGCGGMGRNQSGILQRLEEFRLLGVCDIDAAAARAAGEAAGVRHGTDFHAMLADLRPDVVSICTANASHAALAIAAAEAGVHGIYCEKPMATCLADARRMERLCRERGIVLVINHQRRLGADLLTARRMIESGALGEVKRIRVQCAGDVLSDGTHAIDSALFLAGDCEATRVLGQVHRHIPPPPQEQPLAEPETKKHPPFTGFRYGHPVESGAMAVIGLTGGMRIEAYFGDMVSERAAYQCYTIHGTRGTLWRVGDQLRPNLFIDDGRGGTHAESFEGYPHRPVPAESGGRWRPVETPPVEDSGIAGGYRRFARSIRQGEPHPMNAGNALRGFELVMAIYESARLRRRIELPLEQPRFPLEIMIESGEI